MNLYKHLFILCAVMALAGCISNKPALDTIDELKLNHQSVALIHRKLEEDLINQIFELQLPVALSKFEAKKAKAETNIFKAAEASSKKITEASIKQLEDIIEPQIDNMLKELGKAQASGNRQAEFEIAAQLSATLAVLGKEENKLRALVIEKIARVREEAIAKLEAEFKVIEAQTLANFKTDALAVTMQNTLQKFTESVDSNTTATDEALQGLRDHIDINRLVLKAFTNNLLPDQLVRIKELAGHTNLGSLVAAELTVLQNAAERKINTKVEELESSFREKLATVE